MGSFRCARGCTLHSACIARGIGGASSLLNLLTYFPEKAQRVSKRAALTLFPNRGSGFFAVCAAPVAALLSFVSPSWAWGCPQHRGGQEVSHLVTYLGVYESPVCLQVCVCPRSARRDSALYCTVLILYCTGMYAFASLRREEWRIPGTKTRAIT